MGSEIIWYWEIGSDKMGTRTIGITMILKQVQWEKQSERSERLGGPIQRSVCYIKYAKIWDSYDGEGSG